MVRVKPINATEKTTMRFFEEVPGYKTQENAIRKLKEVVGDKMDLVHWTIAVKDDGRFVPVVHHTFESIDKFAFAHNGIAITG